jgi:hypothetical protein
MNRHNKYCGLSFTPQEITTRRIELERIEMLSGRPDRQTVISKDDCIDLAIALHKCETVEQFIERM